MKITNKKTIFVALGMCVLLMLYVFTPANVQGADPSWLLGEGSGGSYDSTDDGERTLTVEDGVNDCTIVLPTMVGKEYEVEVYDFGGTPTVTLTIGGYSRTTGNGTAPMTGYNPKTLSSGTNFTIEFEDYGVYYANLSISGSSVGWINVTVESSGIIDSISIMAGAIPAIILVAVMAIIFGLLKFRGSGW